MRGWVGRKLAVRALPLILLAGVILPATSALGATYSLQVSTSSNRSAPFGLDGQTVSGTIYVFVSPESGASQVRFWLDNPAMTGTPRKSESNPPWDFAGTNTNGSANPFNTSSVSDGVHSITASVSLSGGGSEVVTATFTVDNDAPPPPSSHTLMMSTSPNRSNPVPLDGRTVSGNIYAFIAPESGLTRVRFWLDNPTMSGTPTKIETGAPWDFAGSNTNGTARPTNTANLSNGAHSITASLSLTSGGTFVLSSTFTVNNQAPPGVADQIHLAWVGDPARSLTVVWHTAQTSTPSQVEYRAQGTSTWATATGALRASGTSGTLHEVTITGLTPGTRYEYRVRADGGAWSAVSSARTAPDDGPATFDAIYFADTGIIGRLDGLATGTAQVIQEMAALDPLLYLPGGDYAYFDTDKRFGTLQNTIDAWFNQMQLAVTKAPMMPTYGNHEALLGEGYAHWAARFPTPNGLDERRNYSFDIGDVHFVSIFAVTGSTGLSSAQLAWIEDDIEAAQAAGQRWIIPYFHVSPFSNGSSHPSNIQLRNQLGPLFERLDVKVVLSSHDQSYERTYPLTGVPSSITRTSTSLTCYDMNDGVSWVKVSPAGKLSNKNGDFSQFTSNPPPFWTAVRDNTVHHFARIRVFASGILRIEIWGVVGNGTTPVIIDSFEYRDGACP